MHSLNRAACVLHLQCETSAQKWTLLNQYKLLINANIFKCVIKKKCQEVTISTKSLYVLCKTHHRLQRWMMCLILTNAESVTTALFFRTNCLLTWDQLHLCQHSKTDSDSFCSHVYTQELHFLFCLFTAWRHRKTYMHVYVFIFCANHVGFMYNETCY